MSQNGIEAQALYQALEREFRPWECTEVFPKVGVQYHNTDRISRVYTATFAGDEVFGRLMAEDASDCMLFTHHPVPQRPDPAQKPPAIPQRYLDFMRENRVTLFSYHIPLDRNGPYSPGNNLAKVIGAKPCGEFYEQNQVRMGVLCRFPSERLEDLCAATQRALGHRIACYQYGGGTLPDGKFAIMAGGAKNHEIYRELAQQGIFAFLTGVTAPRVEWAAENHRRAEEHGVSLIGGTHCSTEKFAPMAMVSFFQGLGIEARFLAETPNLEEL